MPDRSVLLSAARRQYLDLFMIKVFETLHPGEPTLQMAWYLQAMCHCLEQIWAGDLRRTAITVPPRHLKSITVAVGYVAWALGHRPSLKIMVASYSLDLARLHSAQTRTIMETDWYKRDFAGTRISDRGNRALELVTTAGGARKAISVGGSATGFGADIIIIDDCMKADEARSEAARNEVKGWYDNTLSTRLNDKATGRIISIQQRLHEDDLPAYLLDKGFDHLNLPAIAEKEERIAPAPPSPRPVGMREICLEGSNAWAAAAADWLANRNAAKVHASASKTIKELLEDDVARAFGHGIEARRSKSGAVSIRELAS